MKRDKLETSQHEIMNIGGRGEGEAAATYWKLKFNFIPKDETKKQY